MKTFAETLEAAMVRTISEILGNDEKFVKCPQCDGKRHIGGRPCERCSSQGRVGTSTLGPKPYTNPSRRQ